MSTSCDVTAPKVTVPRTRFVTSSTATDMVRTAAKAALACGSTASPAAVRRTVRRDRSSSGWPSSRSSRWICALTAGWATWTRSAALVKLASSTTATRYSSCRSSISDDYSFSINSILDLYKTRAEAEDMTENVLIAGAGIGGLTAALALDARGIGATVIERTDLRPLGVGINLLPHAVRELTELGLGDELSGIAVAPAAIAYYDTEGTLLFREPRE